LINNSTDGGLTYTITRQPIPTNTGGAPSGTDLEIADLNGDGKPDLALAVNEANVPNTLQVWNNTSTGGVVSFAEVGSYTMPGVKQEGRIAIGDLDGDGRPDLVHANGSSRFHVLRNMSTSSAWGFAARQDLGIGFSMDVGIVDMNGDGKQDVVTLSSGNTVDNAYVFANQSSPGSISFASGAPFANGGSAFYMDMALADLDADGAPELAYTNYTGRAVFLAKNAGAGGQPRIGPFQWLDAGANINKVVFNDMDGDQRPDMVYAAGNAVTARLMQPALAPRISSLSAVDARPGQSITINGSGFSTTPTQNQVRFGATWGHIQSATATSLQVTVPTAASMQPVQVLRKSNMLYGQSNRIFVPSATAQRQVLQTGDFMVSDINLAGSRAVDGTIIDLNDDRRPELVVLETNLASPVSIIQNFTEDEELNLANKISFIMAGGSEPYLRLRMADLDGDGLPDMIALRNGRLEIRRNSSTTGNIDFGGGPFFNLPQGGSDVEVADVDGDGRLDLIVTPSISSTGDVYLLLNQGSGNGINLLPPRSIGFTSGYTDLHIGDLNNDGRPELVLVSFDGTLTVAGNQSLPGTPLFTQTLQTGTYPRLMAVTIGDIDGDGRNDVVTAYDGSGTSVIAAAVLRNTGTGDNISFAAPQTLASNEGYDHIMLADLSGDGRPEIVLGGGNAFTELVRNNSQPGQISTTATTFSLLNRPAITFSGDVDVDGRTDMVQLSRLQGAQKLLLNKPVFATEFRLASLVPSTGNIAPAFSPNTNSYTMAVATTTAGIQFTAVPESNAATLRIRNNNGAYMPMTSGLPSPVVNLNPGLNRVDIEVKAENGNAYSYFVNVRRSAAVLQVVANRSSVCIGSRVQFQATVVNPGTAVGFQWFRNGQLVPDSTTASFTVSSFGKTDQVQCRYAYKETGDTSTFTLSSQVFGLKDVFEIAVFVDRNESSDFFDPANWLDYKVPGSNTHVIVPGTSTPGLLAPQIMWFAPTVTVASLQIGVNSGFYCRVPFIISGNCAVLPD
jgi:hypothetical protein